MASKLDSLRPSGKVYTRSWVVRFMLDLAGYVESEDLSHGTIVEPGCGDGAFLEEIVRRLLASALRNGVDWAALSDAIRAYDRDPIAISVSRTKVERLLIAAGAAPDVSRLLAVAWVIEDDFLMTDLSTVTATWIVGNPPYVRVEDVDGETYKAYRNRWPAMSGRADVYVGFYQAALSLLGNGGVVCFICADRWMHNLYGADLRKQIVDDYAMDLIIELHRVDVFAERVDAYPAITLIRRGEHMRTAFVTADDEFQEESTDELRKWFNASDRVPRRSNSFSADWLASQLRSATSWPSGPPERLALIADLEARFPSLVDTGVQIGVGMATGADRVFILKDSESADVEPEFIQPAIGPADLVAGAVNWQGRRIVSPWIDGELAQLHDYPRLAAYLTAHSSVLKGRYVARNQKSTWWRTIDRPRYLDYQKMKLIVADINDRVEPVLDREGYWPLHSAYFITSDSWDLEVLGGYLLSDIATTFVQAYSVKMASGHLRVSSQYLKKVRAPQFVNIPAGVREQLVTAFRSRDREAASASVGELLKRS